jgi:hypothetical protein
LLDVNVLVFALNPRKVVERDEYLEMPEIENSYFGGFKGGSLQSPKYPV